MQSQPRPTSRPRRLHHRILFALAIVAAASGTYLLLLLTAPAAPSLPFSQPTWNKPVPQVTLHEQRIYIPRLQLNLLYQAGDQSALKDGLWWRFSERGNPEKGGNFILSGHRFEIGFSPGETRRKSPLYRMDAIQVDDYIYADFNGQRYQYKVVRKYDVKPSQTEIEAPSTIAKMTLYTCTLKGQTDGREVLEAELVEKNIPPDAEFSLSSEPS